MENLPGYKKFHDEGNGGWLKFITAPPTLKRRVELLQRSTQRMYAIIKAREEKRASDFEFWTFMRREAWIHLRQSLGLLWKVLRKKD